VASGCGCRCFNLGGDALKVLEQLVRGDVRQDNATAHDPPHFPGLISGRLFKPKFGECYALIGRRGVLWPPGLRIGQGDAHVAERHRRAGRGFLLCHGPNRAFRTG